MLLLIDNYDSFTYNLFQYLSELGADVKVVRNDKTTIKDIEEMKPEKSNGLDPRIARMKERLLTAPYEVCMARALHFTRSYKETEGMDPHLRNALALKRTLENQKIFIYPDEYIAGTRRRNSLQGRFQ
jgi:hypothetical protein